MGLPSLNKPIHLGASEYLEDVATSNPNAISISLLDKVDDAGKRQ
jgi:hypothetical protein